MGCNQAARSCPRRPGDPRLGARDLAATQGPDFPGLPPTSTSSGSSLHAPSPSPHRRRTAGSRGGPASAMVVRATAPHVENPRSGPERHEPLWPAARRLHRRRARFRTRLRAYLGLIERSTDRSVRWVCDHLVQADALARRRGCHRERASSTR